MKKTFWIVAPLILIFCVVLLIIALTNNSPDNPLREYRLIIALGFFCAAGFTKIIHRKLYPD
jgi:Na+/citrate or Na+/malate symporter